MFKTCLASKGLLLTALLAVSSPHVSAQDQAEVLHTVSFPGLSQQYIHVRSEIPVTGVTATIKMANWNPGSYLVRDFSSNLARLSFQNGAGQPLAFSNTSKSSWQVDLAGSTRLIAEYDVHAGDLSVNTSWASSDYVLINATSVFLYSDETRDFPHRVQINIPASAGKVTSTMTESGQGNEFLASGFDELVDSPIVISDAVAHRFVDGNYEFALLNVGAGELWDGPKSARDLRAVVHATNNFWGVVPFEHPFWFFNFLVERGGGLEHDYSTVIMGSRWQMRDREDYIKWLSLAAHEYFHAWNIRRMRPQGLASYDYEKEQYSSALWLAEGITSYYDNLLLSRAGLIKPSEYFTRLAIDLHALELSPGRKLISLQQASRDSWIRHYQRNDNTINSTISYYTKGAVLGFVLDTRIRSLSNDEASLDDVMRLMFARWSETPYPDHAFSDAVETIAGRATRDWLQPLLQTTSELDLDEALAWYGLILDRHPVNNAARANNEPVAAGFGVNWDADNPLLTIKNVIHGMSGSAAGLLPGDELLAIEGERVTSATIDDRLMRLQPGMDVELMISRRGRILTVPLILEEARPATYEIKLNPDFGSDQFSQLESWLGQKLQNGEAAD